MLKVPEHQVAGHKAREGVVGPLVDDSGHFYKPLQNDKRGSHEVDFYTAFSSDARIPDHIRKYFPIFYEDVKLVLKKFVSSTTSGNQGVDADCFFASNVYGGSSGILAQLLELKAWFEVQTIYQFYSCSVLIMHEKESILEGKSSGAAVKLIDFAHVVEGEGIIDHNFLGGLCSLIKFISDIVAGPVEKCISDGVPEEAKVEAIGVTMDVLGAESYGVCSVFGRQFRRSRLLVIWLCRVRKRNAGLPRYNKSSKFKSFDEALGFHCSLWGLVFQARRMMMI
ncbi:inositol polyphosphate multikinase beta [Senna tora]|uniref:Inositol polyphosphate multikinase n=1 Tax=Senna tora TaxID=362788 RepID=A0A834WT39_9FABA|nr:inositol polyphosphate multikinase beta [Senna tora]